MRRRGVGAIRGVRGSSRGRNKGFELHAPDGWRGVKVGVGRKRERRAIDE
jgi:hypothetical protein